VPEVLAKAYPMVTLIANYKLVTQSLYCKKANLGSKKVTKHELQQQSKEINR
jgi:hypothetical protein